MKRPAANGFTLLELLLAVSLMALIVGSIMGGIGLGRRAWETSHASEALDEVETAARGVARLLAHSFAAAPDTRMGAPTQMVFQGSREGCRFIALSEGGAQWGGLLVVEIGGDGTDLAVWTRVYRPLEAVELKRNGMQKTVLLKDLASFELAFFGLSQEANSPGWSPNWNDANLPRLVSIRIGAYRLGRVIEAVTTVALPQ
ncbi:prepilin-type N-terminal cleavage/methylation domain-containing protein [Methylocystis sp. 9N]|uniref:Prepilin-type N-terminal cleavage/methylation domain-containing protein n=1 Tax=Methylocystis borbori TaxID=3118750 RepID=A0ABU7XKC9_9HYPH